jgi:hypothetical protein
LLPFRVPQLVVHRPSTSISSIASSVAGVFASSKIAPHDQQQQLQQQQLQDRARLRKNRKDEEAGDIEEVVEEEIGRQKVSDFI